MKAFADLADLPEDARIKIIAEAAAAGDIVGFVVETNKKADRYVKKILDGYPTVRVIWRGQGPIKKSVLVKVGPKGN